MISMANCFQIISKGVVLFILLFSFNELFAAEGGPCKDYGECDKFQYSLNDIESLQRGASTYINYCYGCHSLKYSRWGRVAKDLQIPEDIFFENLVFDKSIKPAAFAFALGFHAAINGVAANGKPDKPTALVRPINTFLLVLSFSCIKGVCYSNNDQIIT